MKNQFDYSMKNNSSELIESLKKEIEKEKTLFVTSSFLFQQIITGYKNNCQKK